MSESLSPLFNETPQVPCEIEMPFHNLNIFDDLPLRLRKTINPYVGRMIEGQSESTLPVMFGSRLRNMRGHWREYFSERMKEPVDKIFLEIGVHKGKVIQALAQDYPKHGIIGMDITMKRVVLSAENLENAGARNGLVVLGNAKYLEDLFTENEDRKSVV